MSKPHSQRGLVVAVTASCALEFCRWPIEPMHGLSAEKIAIVPTAFISAEKRRNIPLADRLVAEFSGH